MLPKKWNLRTTITDSMWVEEKEIERSEFEIIRLYSLDNKSYHFLTNLNKCNNYIKECVAEYFRKYKTLKIYIWYYFYIIYMIFMYQMHHRSDIEENAYYTKLQSITFVYLGLIK